MDQQQTDQANVAPVSRPAMMEQITPTQLAELEAQFDERDRKGFDWRAESFGWTPDQANDVWSWFEAGRRAAKPS